VPAVIWSVATEAMPVSSMIDSRVPNPNKSWWRTLMVSSQRFAKQPDSAVRVGQSSRGLALPLPIRFGYG
jgi:hypothetical protein